MTVVVALDRWDPDPDQTPAEERAAAAQRAACFPARLETHSAQLARSREAAWVVGDDASLGLTSN